MSQNKVQFQTEYRLTDFIEDYGTEEQCRQALLNGVGRTVSVVLTVAQTDIRSSRPETCTNAQNVIIRPL